MHYSIPIATAFAALAAASPAPKPNYVLYFTVSDPSNPNANPTYVSANAVRNGTDTKYIFKGERLSVYPGTPFSYNGVAPTQNIFFNVGEYEPAGLSVVDPGHASGNVQPIYATVGETGDGQWSFNTRTREITHKITATTNEFFICDRVVNGETIGVLSWGNPEQNGSLPPGCKVTKVIAADAPKA